MIRSGKLLGLITVAIVVLAVYRLSGPQNSAVRTAESDRSTLLDPAFKPEHRATDHKDDVTNIDEVDREPEDAATCLTLEQLEYHPVLVQDAYRLDAVITSGPIIASYRGLTARELRGLTEQGDSAAMAVLGAAAVMRARGQPETKAVSYLLHEEAELMTYTFKRPFTPEFLEQMEEAGTWFYEAAQHGRVLALYHVGEALWFTKGGPVELGWIEKEDYDALTSYEKNALLPSNVYNLLAFEIAPELGSGPHGSFISDLAPRSERQQDILDRLKVQFFLDLDATGLPPISVPESTAPPMDELRSLLCKSQLDRLPAP